MSAALVCQKLLRMGGRLLLPGIAAAMLSACGGSNDLSSEEATFHVRSLNLIKDASSVQFLLGTTSVGTLSYQIGTTYSAAPVNTHDVHIKALRPARVSGDTGTTDPLEIGTAFSRTFARDTDYTLVSVGTVASPQVLVLSDTNQRVDVAATKMVWRILHALPGGPAVDVYMTAPEAGISTPQLVTTLNFQGVSNSTELTLVRQTGAAETDALYVDLVIELRAAGTGTVLYNSGEVRFTERTRNLFAITESLSGLGAPVELVYLDNSGAGLPLRDPTNPASARLVHVASDAPALDLSRAAITPQSIATNVAFRGISARTEVPPGSLELVATPTGSPASFLFIDQFNTLVDRQYSVYAVGSLTSTVDAVSLLDEKRPVATQGSFRFLHAAASLQSSAAIDIYFTRSGVPVDFDSSNDSDTTDDAANVRRVTALNYRGSSSYFALANGTYDVYFGATSATSTLLGPVSVQVDNGSIQTFVLTDSGTGSLEMVTVNDLLN